MKKTYLLLLVFITLSSNLYSQGEANNWFLNIDYWISFNNNTIEAVYPPNSPCGSWMSGYCNFFTTLGCGSSISDAEGNLIMYTNGEVIWNANLDTILYSQYLLGDQRSSQCLTLKTVCRRQYLFL